MIGLSDCKFFKIAEETGKDNYQNQIVPESFSKIYSEDIDGPPEKYFIKKIKDNFSALFYVLKWGFFRGRRDELSESYSNCAIKVIRENCKNKNIEYLIKFSGTILDSYEKRVKNEEGYKINKKDKQFLKSLFNKLGDTKNAEYNIVNFIKNKIENKLIEEAYNWLHSIKQVGDKITTCILRDITWLHGLERKVDMTEENWFYLIPVDTWIRQVMASFVGESLNDKEIKSKIISICLSCDTDIIAVNQGLWYIGSHPFEVIKGLLED